MPDSLSITIEGPKLRETPDRLDAAGDFVVAVENYGRATHVHLALDGDLAEVTAIPEPNQFVDSDDQLEVPIRVDTEDRPLEGALTVATGYGADDVRIPVVVGNAQTPTPEPAPEPDTGGLLGSLLVRIGGETLAILAVAACALLLAVFAVQLTQSSVVLFGALLVISSVAGGICYLLVT